MVRRLRRWVVLLLIPLLLTGCWGRLEVNDVGLVTGIGVDQGRAVSSVRITLYLARGMGGSKAGPNHWVVHAEAPTLPDALRHIARSSSRRIILDHTRVIVVGKRYAQVGTGLDDLLDFVGRHSEIRLTPRLLLAEGTAAEIFVTEPHLEAELPEALAKKLEAKGGLNPMLKEFLVSTVALSHSPWIYTISNKPTSEKTKGHGRETVELGGLALFKERKLVDSLTIDETRAFAVLLGHPEDAEMSVPCAGEETKRFSVRLEGGRAKIRPTLQDGQLSFLFKAKVTAVLINSECTHANITVPANRLRFEQAIEAQLLQESKELVKRLQRLQVDPLAAGKRLQIRYPGYFRGIGNRWPEVWSGAQVSFALNVDLHHSNLLLEPVNKTRVELHREP